MHRPTRTGTGRVRFAEVAGGTTAECAAVCCCAPCIVIDFLILAIYKVPAGLYRRALRRRRRQRMKKTKKGGGGPARRGGEYGETDIQILSAGRNVYSSEATAEIGSDAAEKEMWEIFYNTGFWRSPSQRGDQI